VAAQKRNKPKLNRTLAEGFSPKRNTSDFLRDARFNSNEIVRRILEYGAGEQFDKLVRGNCAPDQLLVLLEGLRGRHLALDTWEGRFGFERRDLERVTKRMRDTANDLNRLERNGLLSIAAWHSFKTRFDPVVFGKYVRSIPDSLRTFADDVDRVAKHPSSKPRLHTFANTAMAHLVAYVLHCTGKPHDTEVSALVDAVRYQDGTHCADAQKTWRNEHKAAIHHASQLFPSLFSGR
jgi:hypothetical protein